MGKWSFEDIIKSSLEQMASEIEDACTKIIKDQPYNVKCGECGKDLEATTEIDSDGDMIVIVDQCPCILEEYKLQQDST